MLDSRSSPVSVVVKLDSISRERLPWEALTTISSTFSNSAVSSVGLADLSFGGSAPGISADEETTQVIMMTTNDAVIVRGVVKRRIRGSDRGFAGGGTVCSFGDALANDERK